MLLSLSKAAKQSKKSKSVLAGAIKSGRLSATKDDKGHWQIDTAELFRAYPQVLAEPVLERGTSTPQKNEIVPPIEPLEIRLLEQQITAKDEKIAFLEKLYDEKTAFLKSQLEEAKGRETELLTIVKNQTLLLTHEKTKQEEPKQIKRRWLFFKSA